MEKQEFRTMAENAASLDIEVYTTDRIACQVAYVDLGDSLFGMHIQNGRSEVYLPATLIRLALSDAILAVRDCEDVGTALDAIGKIFCDIIEKRGYARPVAVRIFQHRDTRHRCCTSAVLDTL